MRFFETIKTEDKPIEENRKILSEIQEVIDNTRLVEFSFGRETSDFKDHGIKFLESILHDASEESNKLYECLISVFCDQNTIKINVYGLEAIIEIEKKSKAFLK